MTETVDGFRARARTWISTNLRRRESTGAGASAHDRLVAARDMQARMYDAGLAGVTWPRAYGGQELTVEHLRALDDELRGYETPFRELSISVGVIGPTLLELGTDDQKAKYLPRLLRGDDLWVQYLSEPTGGSDLAGAVTRATRDGDTWVLDGSKVWTTFGEWADHAVCLARTNWSVPKHAGLSMFIVAVDSPGLTVAPLRKSTGESEFCQEFLDGVVVSDGEVLGAVDDGWQVASKLLEHERTALGGGSVYFSMGSTGESASDPGRELAARADTAGRWSEPVVRELIAEVHVDAVVGSQLAQRVKTGSRLGHFDGPAGSLLKLFNAMADLRRTEVGLVAIGPSAAASSPGDSAAREAALAFIGRQGGSLAGGSDEIQRNIISERVLGLPREPAIDKGVPFDQVRRNRVQRGPS